jgi:hypothetical protein
VTESELLSQAAECLAVHEPELAAAVRRAARLAAQRDRFEAILRAQIEGRLTLDEGRGELRIGPPSPPEIDPSGRHG